MCAAAVLLTICAAVAAAGCGRRAATGEPRPPASLPMPAKPEPTAPAWMVVSVHDGDTLREIDQANVQHEIRLAGIDAPELGQPFGRASRDRLGDQAVGKLAAVVLHDRGRYGCDRATLFIDGVNVNRQLVAEGLAWHFNRDSDDARLAAARPTRSGLWAEKAPVAPWDWRACEAERKQ